MAQQRGQRQLSSARPRFVLPPQNELNAVALYVSKFPTIHCIVAAKPMRACCCSLVSSRDAESPPHHPFLAAASKNSSHLVSSLLLSAFPLIRATITLPPKLPPTSALISMSRRVAAPELSKYPPSTIRVHFPPAKMRRQEKSKENERCPARPRQSEYLRICCTETNLHWKRRSDLPCRRLWR